jgi:hypothetical protein
MSLQHVLRVWNTPNLNPIDRLLLMAILDKIRPGEEFEYTMLHPTVSVWMAQRTYHRAIHRLEAQGYVEQVETKAGFPHRWLLWS